jgi:hypothetical protein
MHLGEPEKKQGCINVIKTYLSLYEIMKYEINLIQNVITFKETGFRN